MKTILLCDDEEILRDLMADIIYNFNFSFRYNILKASSGMEGLKILDENQVDLIISDVRMPNGYGYVFVDNPKHVPVIFTTGFVEPEISEKIKGNVVLTKPVDFRRLEKLIKQNLGEWYEMVNLSF